VSERREFQCRWGTFLMAPDEFLSRIDQIAVEFHGIDDQKSVAAVRRLKQFFEVAHTHFNNATCFGGMKPFPSWTYILSPPRTSRSSQTAAE
jgi:hypothetical protein